MCGSDVGNTGRMSSSAWSAPYETPDLTCFKELRRIWREEGCRKIRLLNRYRKQAAVANLVMFALEGGGGCLDNGFIVPSTLPPPCNQVKGNVEKLESDLGEDKKFHHNSLSVWWFYWLPCQFNNARLRRNDLSEIPYWIISRFC